MARTKGTKNRDGHRAGGARKGAGRKRKASTERASEDEESSESNPDAGLSSIPDNYIDVNHIHPALKQYINVPHHVPLVVTPMLPSREAMSESSPSFRLSYAAWDSTSGGDQATQSNEMLRHTVHNPQRLVTPTTSQSSRSLPPSLMPFSQRSASEPARPDFVHPPVASDMGHLDHSQEPSLRLEEEQTIEGLVQDVQPPDATSGAATTQPSSPTRSTVPRSRLIAPAPLSPQQRTWMFPYPLPAIMSSPFHRLAIVSQGSSSKRRRRRCAVCIQLGKEETSYDCPGRGDRSRCPFSRKRDEAAGIPPKRRRKVERKPKDSETPNLAVSKSGHSGGNTPLQSAPAAPTQPSVLIPHGYIPLTPYGQPVQHFVLSSGETAKRRARRCMVCVARGKDGTSCAGRGSRTWCPDYDEELDARTIKWPPFEEEQEGHEFEPEAP